MKASNVLSSAFIIIAITSLLFGCGGAEQRKTKYIQEGTARYDQGDWEKARIGFKNALQIDPNDKDALYKYGLTLERLQDWRNAAGIFQKLSDEHADFYDAKIHLGQIMLLAKEANVANKQADEVISKDPSNVGALTLKAGAAAISGQTAEGIGFIEKALKISSDDTDAMILASSLYQANGDKAKALEILQRGMKVHSDKTDFIVLTADYMQREKRLDEARALIEKAIEKEPKVFAHRARLAQLYAVNDDAKNVEVVLRKAMNDFPEDKQVVLSLVDYLVKKNQTDSAIALLDESLKKNPTQADFSFAEVEIYRASKKLDKAKEILKNVIKNEDLKPNGLSARSKLANIELNENKVDEAEKLITEVLKENANDSDALTIRAKLAISRNKFNDAIPDLRTVLRDQPQSYEANDLLVFSYMQVGNKDLAKEQLSSAIKLIPNNVLMRMQYASLLAGGGDLSKAEKELSDVIAMAPLNVKAYVELTRVLLFEKKQSEATAMVEKLRRIAPDSVETYLLATQLQLEQKNYLLAENELKKALEKNPNSSQVLEAIVGLYSLEKKYELAYAVLDGVKPDSELEPFALNLKGEIQVLDAKEKDAESNFNKSAAKNQKWWKPYANLATLYSKNKNEEKAIEILLKGIDQAGGAVPLRSALAAAYEKVGKVDDAISQYSQVLTQTNNSADVANNLAMLIVTYKSDPASLDRAAELVQTLKQSGNANFLDTVGWVYYKRGDFQQGVQYLTSAVQKAPDFGLLRYHLGMAQLKSNDKVAAKSELEKAVSSGQNFPGLTEAKSVLSQLSEG